MLQGELREPGASTNLERPRDAMPHGHTAGVLDLPSIMLFYFILFLNVKKKLIKKTLVLNNVYKLSNP